MSKIVNINCSYNQTQDYCDDLISNCNKYLADYTKFCSCLNYNYESYCVNNGYGVLNTSLTIMISFAGLVLFGIIWRYNKYLSCFCKKCDRSYEMPPPPYSFDNENFQSPLETEQPDNPPPPYQEV